MVLVLSVGLDRVPSQGLDCTDRTNYSRTGLEPRERFEHSFGRSTPRAFLLVELSPSRSSTFPPHLLLDRVVPAKGTPTLK